MKLKTEFVAELPIKQALGDIVSMTALLPFYGQRAIAFGWLHREGEALADELYWLAEIRREGVTHRILPRALTERLVQLTRRPQGTGGSYTRIQAFRFGDGFGLLLGTQEVHLFSAIGDEAQVISVGNSFVGLGEARHSRSLEDGHYLPLFCGHSCDSRIPVVLSSPRGRIGEGRHLSLLDIDAVAAQARWVQTDQEGAPHSVRFADYAPFLNENEIALSQISVSGREARSPLVRDCAWYGESWRLYAGGLSLAAHRFGLAPSLLSEHRPDLSMQTALLEAPEESFGRIGGSLDRLILTPLRKNGPAKGKQSIYRFDDSQIMQPTLPRGYTKHSIVEYSDGCYWLSPMPWGYGCDALVACSEA